MPGYIEQCVLTAPEIWSNRYKYGTFTLEFLHIGAVIMLDIKYTCSLICVEVRCITHSQELLSNALLQYVKYMKIWNLQVSIWDIYIYLYEFLHTGAVKLLDIKYTCSLLGVRKYGICRYSALQKYSLPLAFYLVC